MNIQCNGQQLQSAIVAAAPTWLGGGGWVSVRQDGSDSGGKTAATKAAVVARTWIGSLVRAVEGQHQVVRNSNVTSASAATAEAQFFLFLID